MGKPAPSQPAPIVVNPTQSATGQAAFNEEAARKQRALNMVDQYTPEGSLTYRDTGFDVEGIPQFAAIKSLSPEQQGLYDTANRLSQSFGGIGEAQLEKVGGSLSSPLDIEGAVGAAPGAPDFTSLGAMPVIDEGARTGALEAILARNEPRASQDKAALETQLVNQGFVRGSEGFDNAMDEYLRSQNDFRLGADIQAGGEMERMFGLQTRGRQQQLAEIGQEYGLQGNARDRAINEILMSRNQPLTELSALMSGSQPSGPSFVPTPQTSIGAPDFMGAEFANANIQNTAAQNAFNQAQGQYNANLEGLYGLGGAGLSGFNWG